jgi:hypothetical protein
MRLFGRNPGKTTRASGGLFAWGEPVPVAPVHHVAPGTRELRAQAVHRLQVGLFGLAGMLLLVSLANVIMDRAQQVDESAAVASASASPANDPLVDMGVAPELPVDGAANPAKPAKAGPHH